MKRVGRAPDVSPGSQHGEHAAAINRATRHTHGTDVLLLPRRGHAASRVDNAGHAAAGPAPPVSLPRDHDVSALPQAERGKIGAADGTAIDLLQGANQVECQRAVVPAAFHCGINGRQAHDMHVRTITKSVEGGMDLSGFVNGGGNSIQPNLPTGKRAAVCIVGVEKTGRPPVPCQEKHRGVRAGDRARIVQDHVSPVAIIFIPHGKAVVIGSSVGDRPAIIQNKVVALGTEVSRLGVPIGTGVFRIEQTGVLEQDRAVVPAGE